MKTNAFFKGKQNDCTDILMPPRYFEAFSSKNRFPLIVADGTFFPFDYGAKFPLFPIILKMELIQLMIWTNYCEQNYPHMYIKTIG